MSFRTKFASTLSLLALAPLLFVPFLAKSGATDCVDKIEEELIESSVSGDFSELKNVNQQEECDPHKGKFAFVEKSGDWLKKYYVTWFLISIILSAIFAGTLEIIHLVR